MARRPQSSAGAALMGFVGFHMFLPWNFYLLEMFSLIQRQARRMMPGWSASLLHSSSQQWTVTNSA